MKDFFESLKKRYHYAMVVFKELVKTDFQLRYQGSFLGMVWSVLKPLMLFAVMYVVFVKFLKFSDGTPTFPISLLCGTCLWSFFSESTSMGMRAIVDRGDLLRKPQRYEPIGTETRSFYEGCLSFDGYQAVRKRWLDITARWQDEDGNKHEEHLHGWPARIFQHETDHLSGELYIDQAEIRSLTTNENLEDFWCEDPVPTEAAAELGFEL